MQNIPSIFGFTVDEAMAYVAGAFSNKISNLQYRAAVTAIAKGDAREVMEKYPPQVILFSFREC